MEITQTILVILAAICSANAFSKYGRTCKDIGCTSSETCVMAEDSCSYYQEKNKECGAYPTCKKTASINQSPGSDSSGHNIPPRPYAPPPSTNSGGQNIPGFNPNPSAPNLDPSTGNRGNHIYPNLPTNGNNDPHSNRNNGNIDPYPNRGSYDPTPTNNRGGTYPSDPYGNRGGTYPSDPYGNRGGSYPSDPYGNRGNGYGNRDDDRNKGSSSGDSGSGSTLNSILNFLRGSGGSGGPSRTPSSSGSGLSYGDIFNALSNGGNRGGSSSGGSGLSDILKSFGNRGPENNYDRNYDDRRQQPSPNSGGGSSNSGFLSSLSSIFGQQLANSIIQNAISGNRGTNTEGNSGGSGLINSLRYGGLFNENNGHSASNDNKPKVTVSGAGPGGYPTQAPYHPPNNNYSNNNQAIQSQNYNTNNNAARRNATETSQPTQSGQKPAYGWSV